MSAGRLRIVILAAGLGSRLGHQLPKALSMLPDGSTILGRQLDLLRHAFGPRPPTVVVGFRRDTIMHAHPEAEFVHNAEFAATNTARSLALALGSLEPGPVLWLNGDVVFEASVLDEIAPAIASGRTAICVNTAAVGAEEIKYTLDRRGRIRRLSKTVEAGLGEAVGINVVSARDRETLLRRLRDCKAHDYFERGVELAIERDRMAVYPVDIGTARCIEVDFAEDLARASRDLFPAASIEASDGLAG